MQKREDQKRLTRNPVTLPDDIPYFPLVAGEIELGVSGISKAGNESEITKISVSIDFIVPTPHK
jgi:hypothetical protein